MEPRPDTPDPEDPAPDASWRALFCSMGGGAAGGVAPRRLLRRLADAGLDLSDPRLGELAAGLRGLDEDAPLASQALKEAVTPNMTLVRRALEGRLVLPEFSTFRGEIESLFEEAREERSGAVASYIPQLARVDPELYGAALCSVDGQRVRYGDARVPFSVQSCSKPVTYCLALEEHGEDVVHSHVGREPSGRGFNELTLDHDRLPHNPMINAGAIMSCSLIRPGLASGERFDEVLRRWQGLAGGLRPGFNNAVYLSERRSADRNFALGYFMREHGAFPSGIDLVETLEFYFQCCSIEVNAEMLSIVAATLANGGVCPLTEQRLLAPRTVRNCLSLMSSCGMYDYSGEFAFSIGLPAKSGVSGSVMVVVPGVLGFCSFSPRLDRLGNSARGIELCRQLVERYKVHGYDWLPGLELGKKDPTLTRLEAEVHAALALIWAASQGDLRAVQREQARGVALTVADYDGRTALHLAAAGGHSKIIELLIDHGVELSARDRWGQTPLAAARQAGHAAVAELLLGAGAEEG